MAEPTPKLILVARVAGAFGVRGEVKLTTYTADPLAITTYGPLLRKSGEPMLKLTAARAVKGGVVARAKEIATREEAEALRGTELYVPREALPEPQDEDEFYLADLIGLSIENAAGEVLGRVKTVQDFGAGDLIEVAPVDGGATWWLPFTKETVPEVRLAAGVLIAHPPGEAEDEA